MSTPSAPFETPEEARELLTNMRRRRSRIGLLQDLGRAFDDQHGNELHMFGFLDEPMTGEHDKVVKHVYRFVDDKTFVIEVHDLPIASDNTKVMEFEFRRM